jgi:hypothetical protein
VVSVQPKNFIASPKALIVLFGIVGAVVWGVPGLLGGLAAGFILTSLIGIALRGSQARRRARVELSKKVIVSFPDVVGAAFPDLAEDGLERAVEEQVEKLCQTAARMSPGHRLAWPSPEMRMARFKLETETESEALVWRGTR